MIELDCDKRREAAIREETARDAEVRGVFRGQSRFALGGRSNLAAGGGLAPFDQQYMVTDSETGKAFLVFDRRVIWKGSLAADIRRQLRTGIATSVS
jgi:hypothetical protein